MALFYYKQFWIILLILVSLPVLLKRKITAMKWNSRLLFVGIGSLLLIFLLKSFDNKNKPTRNYNCNIENIVNSINVTITTYGFIINLFPITEGMKDKSSTNVMKAVALALFFCFATYLVLTLCCLQIYGSSIDINLFQNIVEDKNWLSYLVRLIFLVIFFTNIPFVFYPGKLSVVNIIAEYQDHYFSSKLEHRSRTRSTVFDISEFNNNREQLVDTEEKNRDPL